MKCTLEPGAGADSPYTLHISDLTDTVLLDTTLKIPVHYAAAQATYNVELAGFRVESADVAGLAALAKPLVDGLINMARLPSYVFVARRSNASYPVYTVGDEVFATTPGGPVFRHLELAKVREYLTDYLHLTGVLGTPGLSDKLHVRGVNPETLELERPVLYLKKRVANQTDFWAPVFSNGTTLYAYAASRQQSVPIGAGKAVLELQSAVATALIADKRLPDTYDLRPDRLMPDQWARLKAHCTPEGPPITAGDSELPVYRCGELVIAVENRTDSDGVRPSLYLAASLAALEERVLADFERRGHMAVA